MSPGSSSISRSRRFICCRVCGTHRGAKPRFTRLLLFRQARTNDLFIVPRENALVGVCRMAPNDGPPKGFVRWLYEMGPANFVVFLGRKASDDQVAGFAEQKITVAVLRQEHGAVRLAALTA